MIGIDVVALDRVRRAVDRWERFPARILGPEELERWGTSPEAVALCFAVKESVIKALGGWGDRGAWTSIDVSRPAPGEAAAGLDDQALGEIARAVETIRSGTWTRGPDRSGWWAGGEMAGAPYVIAIAAAKP